VIVVVKVGGHALDHAGLADVAWTQLASDLGDLVSAGDQVVVVHGAGPRIDEVATACGVPVEFVDGLRVTSPDMMAVVARAVGHVTADLVATCRLDSRLRPLGIVGASVISGEARGDAWGLVAGALDVDGASLHRLLDEGFVPLISCVVSNVGGGLLNANADAVAGDVARALGADVLVQITDVPQLRANLDDPASALSRVSADEVAALLASGAIRDGMIPKMTAALAAIADGVGSVVMASGVEPGAVGRACRREGTFTEVVR
jgi:acetylglutamate kinase